MFGDLLEVFGLQLEETPPPTSWWGYQPAPKPHFLVFCDVISDLMSLLWTTNLGTATWMNTGVAAAICFFAVFALWLRWSLRRRKKRSVALLSADQWKRSQLLCHKCCFCKELKKSERHWKPGINESSEDSLEQDIYCMKKKQHNATQVFDKLMFEEAKGALNESKAVNESSFETPFFDHLSCDCCKKTSAHSFGTVTSENLSYMKSRSISYNTSQHDALKGGGKGCLASSESRQTFLKQDLLGMYTSVGTNTSDQFSSEEIWRMTPSVTWTNTEELCITNKYLDDKSLDTSRSSTTWKETEYSNHDSEKYLVSSLDFTKDETTKSSLSENAKKAASQLSTPESSFSNITQTTKTSYSTAPSVKKIPCVNAKKLESLSTLQTPVCSQLTPVSTSVGFDTISCCSSDDCSSFAHYSDAQWSSESPWPVSTSSNTATRNAHFSVTERETSECMSSPSSPTGQTLLASRAITDKLERMPAQNNFTNNSNYSGFQEKGLPDSEMKQMESLAFSKLKNQLPLPNTYHSEEKYAKVKSTNFHRHPVVQEIALLTQENVEKFELLQLRKNVQSVLPFVAEKLETTKKSQGITDKDWQRENVVYQAIPSVVPRLDENQIRKLELNVAQMALESQWGLPFIHRKSLSTMMLPLSPLRKKSAEPTVKEIKPPILTESEVCDLEFNLQRRIGIHQWRPSVKEVNPVDSADVTIVRSEVPTFNERQATCLKLNLGKNVTHKWNGLSQRAAEIQKSPEAPLEDDSVALVEIKAEDVEKSPVYHNQETHFEVKPITNATEDKVENVNKPDALQQQPASAHQSSKTEAELMNESVVQEIDMANGNIEIIQLTKTENMQQLNSGELQMKMDTFTKKNCISETIESKERLPVQPGVSSKASEKEKIYQAIARQGLMTPTPLSILAANTISLANLKNRLISHFQEYPINFEKSARVITPQGASLTTEKDVQIEPTGVESAFIDEKMRNCLEWHITQKKLQYSWDLSSNFERPTEVLISPSPKWIPSQLIDPAVIPTELPFITVEHKKIIEGNVKRKIAGNKLFIKLSLDDMVHAPLQSEDMVRNNSFLKSTDTPYLKIMPHQEKDVKGREKIFLSHAGGIRNGERNKLKELSVTAFQPKEKNQLNICLTKQCVEMKVDCLPDVVMESYEKFYRPAPKKHLPKLITVGKGYKKPRLLYIPFMECNAVDHLEINLKQKLISSLWGSPNLFEKSLETMIPKAPPVPPPIKARAAKIKPIGTETDFIEEKNKNHLERHITQRKLELNWALPTEIQRSRATFMPPAPKLIHSQLKSQYYAYLVIVLTEPSFISNKHKKTLEDNLRKKIINHKRGILPNVVQMSLMNFMNSYSMKDAIAPSEIIKGRKMLAGNLDCYKRTIHHTQTSLLLEYVDNGKGTELNEVVKDKLGMCIRKHCLEIKLNYFPEIVKEMYKVTYSLESKSGLPKLIALGRGYKKSQPHYIPFIEQDLIDRLELNLKHKQISQLWELETLHKKSLEMMISNEQFLLPAIKTIVAKVEPVALKTHFISNHTRLLLEWHIKQKKLQYNWGVPLHILRSQQVFIPAAPKLIVSQLKLQPDFDVNIIPIEPAFLCAESKKKLELNVKKRIINHYWGLPKFVCLSLESFIPHAPSVNSVKPQSGIEENESQVNCKLKTVSLPSTLLRLKGGKLTAPQCEQDIKFVKSSKKRTLPVLAGLKLEHKDKLDMYLIKQCLDIKLNHLPSIVQELYKNTYPSEPKKTLSKFLRAGEDLKKTRPGYIPFFEHDAINKLEVNLKNKHLSHLWGFQTLHEESMEIMIPKAPPVLPAIKANRSQIEAVSMEMAFLGRDARGKLEWHIIQKKLQHNWGLPFCYQNSMEAFIPAAPKLIVSQLKPQPDFDVNIIPIEPAFLCAESKKKLELNVKKRIINHHWGLPKFVCLSLESFILRAPSVNSVKPQSGIEENESQVNGKFKTVSLPSTLLRLKGGKLTTPQCEQDIKFVKSSKKRTLPVLAGLKLEHKDKLDMYLIKQCLDIKLNHLPSIVQELYKNTYPSKPKKTLSKFLRAGEDLKKTRPGYIPFFEHDAIDKLEMNLKNKHLSHLWGFQTLHEESMEIMIPKAPPVLPAIKANRSQIEAVSMEMAFLGRDARGKLEWHIIQKKLQHNWGLPSCYQNSVEAFIPAAPKLVPSLVNPQVDFHVLITPCELSFVDVEISKKLELNIRKKVINQRWGLPKCIQSSLRDFMGPAPLVNVIKSSEAVAHKKNNNIGIRETCRTENPQKQSMQLNGKKLTSAQYKREKRKSKTKSGGKFIFTYLKQEDKDKLDVCLIKQCLEIHMNTLPEMVTNFYKITYPPNSERSFPQLILPRNGFKKPRASYISFIEQDIVDQLELNLKHKQINHLWGFATPYVESLGMMICSGPPIPPTIKASGAQIEPVSREINFSAEFREDFNMHITRKKLQQNWDLPLHIQKSESAFIPPAPKLILSKLNPQPDFVIIFSLPELTFLHEEHKRRLEFNVKKKIVNYKWGLPKVVLSSMCNFMAPAPTVKDLIPQHEIIKNKKIIGNTCIEKKSKVLPQDTFPLRIQRKILLPQNERGSHNKKTSNKIVGFSGLKPEHKDKLDICVTKQSLEVKMHCIPKLVTVFYKNTYATPPKKVLPRRIALSEGLKKPRSMYIPFIEQDAVDRLELNLKHKQIIHLWALDTQYEVSIKMIIPEGPNVNPVIRSKGVQIEPVGIEIAFIKVEARNILEWHITQKKLENNWDLPLHIQKSIDMHIPPAPKLVRCQLKQHCFYAAVVKSAEPVFISSEHRKRLELNIKKKIINQKWGLPNLIQLSWKHFMASPPSLQDHIPKSKIMKGVKTFPNADVEFNLKMVMRHEKGKLLSLIREKVSKKANIGKINAFPEFAILEKEYKHKLNTCLLMQVLNTKMHFLPDIVQEYYKNSYPAISKKPLSKPFFVSEGFKKQRPRCLPFVEQDAIDRLELNLKHKLMIHLWKCETLYDKSMKVMIPEGPPVSPAIKVSGAKVGPVGMETSCIEYDTRDALDWHITQKKLQQNWGFPLHIQISAELFILPAPKLIPSQLNPKPCFGVIVVSNELEFLSEEHRKLLELNTKKKIINYRWGLPTLIQSSLKIFMGLNGLRNDRMLTMARNAGLSNINIQSKVGIPSHMKKVGTLPLQCKKDSKNTYPSKTRVADIFAILKQENIDKLDVCLRKLHLEIELHCLPEMVKQFYKESYPSKSKKLLKKSIVPGEGCKKPCSLYIAFIEQDAVDRLELNLKHQLIVSLWGLATLYEKSTEMMFARGPPVPPTTKSSGVKIEPTGMETLFIADNVRENLERCVIQKKLQNTWGLPLYVQRSEEAFIPFPPKLILSQLKPQPAFSFVTVPNELAFLHDDHKKVLEINIKKKIINCKWGLPKLIQSSLNSFIAASSDLCSLTNTGNNESKTIPPHTFPKSDCGKLTTLQGNNCDRSKKMENIDDNLFYTSLKPDWKHILETCVIKLCLEIKIGYFPEMVTKFYENTYPSQSKKPLPKLIVFGGGFKKRRQCYLPFIEQDAIDCLELNLKHKNIIHLWEVPTLYDESKEIMNPEGPPVPPTIKGSGALIHPVQLETSFIEDEVKAKLEWHITQKKLQLSFGLPLLILKSQEAFIPSAPKLIPSQLKVQLDLIYVFVSPELSFLSSEQRKGLELITRKRIINYKWGLPKAVQHSLNNFMPLLSLQSEMMERNELSFCGTQAKNKRAYVPMSTCLQPKSAKVSSKQNQESGGVLKPNNMAERGLSAKLPPECKDKLESCLTKQCLDIKFCFLPEIVYKTYEETFPPISRKPFPKQIEPGKGFKKSRSLYIPFIEQNAVDCLELSLKQKYIMHLWGITTLFKESVALMIPKQPPDPPAIKASGAQIEHVGMETTFIDSEIKERLEWHIVQKKLQHNWGLPLHIQISQEAFIPPAPKLIASQLKPWLGFAVVVVPAELTFLPDGCQKVLELNMKKRIINSKWGLPKSIQLSVRRFIPPAPQMRDVIIQPQKQPMSVRIMPPPAGSVLWMKREKLLLPTLQESVKENHEASFANFKIICRDVIDLCLIKQCLEIKMGHLLNLVKDTYKVKYAQGLEKTLTKTILPGQGFKKQRASYMPFIVQETIDRLELNLKHKQIIHLWGLLNPHEESMEMMIPKAPPLPPIIKASGDQIEPVGMETIFIESKTRERLEWQITQKKLQYNWGLPTHIQSSLDAFIPLAPKLILLQLRSKFDFTVVVAPSEIAFLSDEVKHILERNIKKRIINRKWGLPKVIYSSLIQFMPLIPVDKSFILPSKDTNESNITYDNLGKSYEIFSQSTNLRLKGGKLIPQCEKVEMTMHKEKEISSNLHLRPECKHNLNVSLTKQCLETKMDCIPKLVKNLYKITYPLVSKKQLPKIIVPGTGFKRTRINYIPSVEQDAVHRIEMNLKLRQILCLWELETLYEKSMEIMIPEGPPMPPLVKTGRVGIKPVGEATSPFSDEATKLLEWHILQKKLQHTWGSPSYFQKSVEAFIPPAPELILTQLNPQPNFKIEIAPVELAFINNEHKKALEMNTKKRIINHRWGLPKVIESSLNEFMAPHLIKDLVTQLKIKEEYGMWFRTEGLSKNYKMASAQCASHLSKVEKSTLDCEWFKESVRMKTRETFVIVKLSPESKNKLNMCLMKQNLSNKLDCVPDLVTELYQQTYLPVLKKPLAKPITAGKGFKRPRSSYILFAEQDVINCIDVNLKYKQLNNLWGTATPFDMSIEKMIPEGPPLFPAIKATRAKIEHVGMELTFQSAETIDILEWHIETKKLQHHLGIPLHIQRSIDTFIPPPPKLVLSQFNPYPNFDIAVSTNDLTFVNEELKETLETNTNNQIINHSGDLHTSLNNFILPAPPIKKDMQLSRTGERNTAELKRCELSKTDIIVPTDQKSMTRTNCRDFDESSNDNYMEEPFACPNLESKDKEDGGVAEQSLEMQSLDKCTYSDASKHFLNPNTPYTRSKKQNKTKQKKQKRKCCANYLNTDSFMKNNGSSTWISDQKLADSTYKPMTSERLSLSSAIIGENLTSSPLTVQEDLNFYLKQDTNKHFLNPNTAYKRSKKQNKKQKRKCDADNLDVGSVNGSSTWISDQKLADLTYKPMTSERLALSPSIIGENLTSSPLTVQEDLNFYLKQDTNKHFLNLNTPYTRSKKQNKKQKGKCYADNLDIDSVNRSSTWISDQKLADLTYKPMTSERLSLSSAIIGENLTSSPLTVREDLNFYLKQITDFVTLSPPGPYVDCEEMLSKNARDVGNNESCSEQLTEEAKIHIQQAEKHAYVKIITSAIKNQNEEENMQIDLSEMICSQPPPAALRDSLRERMIIASQIPDDGNYLSVSDEELHDVYHENLNKSYHTSKSHIVKKKCRKASQSCYSNQTKPDETLVKPKTKFSRQGCQRPRTFKHEEEGRNSELGNQSAAFVGPSEELQNPAIMTCGSDTDEKEKSLTQETPKNYKDNKQSLQSSTLHSLGCQQVLPNEDPPFATNEDSGVHYQCESPFLTHTVH